MYFSLLNHRKVWEFVIGNPSKKGCTYNSKVGLSPLEDSDYATTFAGSVGDVNDGDTRGGGGKSRLGGGGGGGLLPCE